MSRPISAFFLALLAFGCSSCFNTKKATYFNNATDTTYLQANTENEVLLIQKNDILSISISSLSTEASAIFNTTNNFAISTATASGINVQSAGYLVNTDGNIQLPILGNIKAAGLSKKQLKDNITQIILFKKLLIDPIVNIRHLNFEVTVIGEVGRPTVITVSNEKISLIKALGLAGDITIYGKKDNVLLIRESEGQKKVTRIDLNSDAFLNSPYYYLMPNDVIYVEANKNRMASVGRGWQLMPPVLSAVLIIVMNRIL